MAAKSHHDGVIYDVLGERLRQLQHHGYTHEHDAALLPHALTLAAIAYATHAAQVDIGVERDAEKLWPFAPDKWHPSTSRRQLIKAAALLVAEVERMDRAEGGE